jgi:hypothetical protein
MGDVVGKVVFSLMWFVCTAILCRWWVLEGRLAYRRGDASGPVKARIAVAVTGVVATCAYAAVLASWPEG